MCSDVDKQNVLAVIFVNETGDFVLSMLDHRSLARPIARHAAAAAAAAA